MCVTEDFIETTGVKIQQVIFLVIFFFFLWGKMKFFQETPWIKQNN